MGGHHQGAGVVLKEEEKEEGLRKCACWTGLVSVANCSWYIHTVPTPILKFARFGTMTILG